MGSVKMMGVKREPQTLAELMSQPDLVYPAPAWQPEPAPDQLAAEERKAAAQLSYDEALEILLQAERAIEGAGGSEYMTRDFQMRISGTNQEVIKNAAGMRSAAAGLVEEARTELQAAQAALSDILVARDRRHRIEQMQEQDRLSEEHQAKLRAEQLRGRRGLRDRLFGLIGR